MPVNDPDVATIFPVIEALLAVKLPLASTAKLLPLVIDAPVSNPALIDAPVIYPPVIEPDALIFPLKEPEVALIFPVIDALVAVKLPVCVTLNCEAEPRAKPFMESKEILVAVKAFAPIENPPIDQMLRRCFPKY